MASYDSRDFEELDLPRRFPKSFVGVHEWEQLIKGLRDQLNSAETRPGQEAILGGFGGFLQSVAALRPPSAISRVFVSHQRGDREKAERVAWHATEWGFEYWLDVHDPKLALRTHV